MTDSAITFAVQKASKGGYEALALGQPIVAEAESIAELREKVRGAVQAFCKTDPTPTVVLLQFAGDEVLSARNVSTSAGDSALPSAELSEDGKKLALDYFNHVETQVGLAATTAYLVLVADTILLTSFVTIFKDSALSGVWVETAGTLLAVGMALALVAVIPHMRKKGGTVFYYRKIAGMTEERYFREFRGHDKRRTLHHELLKQVRGKCQHLRWMFRCIIAAIICIIVGTAVMLRGFVLNEKISTGSGASPLTHQSLPVRQ